jgi:hypothetical protein
LEVRRAQVFQYTKRMEKERLLLRKKSDREGPQLDGNDAIAIKQAGPTPVWWTVEVLGSGYSI